MFTWFKKKNKETHSDQMWRHVLGLDAHLSSGTLNENRILISKLEEQRKSWDGGKPINECSPIAQAQILFYQSMINMIKTRCPYGNLL